MLQGQPFLSSSVNGHEDGRHLGNRPSPTTAPPIRQPGDVIPGRHEVVFYSDDRQLIGKLTEFVGVALSAGNAAVVVATGPHQQDLLQSLQANQVDIAAAIEQGRYIAMDAADAVAACMVNGIFDAACFLKCFSNLIAKAAKAVEGKHGHVVVFGEGVDLLMKQGYFEAAMEDEKLGTQLCKSYGVDILCAYSLQEIQANEQVFHQICAEHSAVYHV